MLFKPDLCEAILQGRKTQTRRVVKQGELGCVYHHLQCLSIYLTPDDKLVYVMRPSGILRWSIGRTYSIQPGRGKRGIGRIWLHHLGCERLQDITYEDIRAEGVSLPPIDPDIMLTQYNGWRERRLKDEFIKLWDTINKKGSRWEDNPLVWVLTFTLAGD